MASLHGLVSTGFAGTRSRQALMQRAIKLKLPARIQKRTLRKDIREKNPIFYHDLVSM